MSRLLVATSALLVALACAATARPATVFVLKGHGWGHGIGLAQYGAQGYAEDGKTYDTILKHYFQGTELGTRTATRRVLLSSGRTSVTIGSSAPFTAKGVAQPFAAGTWTVTVAANGRLRLVNGGLTRVVRSGRVFQAGSKLLRLSGARYRGTIALRRSGNEVWALNKLGLEPYVRGVVPREMPSSWHPEALKAQAVAARTYSLATSGKCDWFGSRVLCPTTSDQVYGGRDAETGSTNAAVKATAGKVVLHDGAPALTVFSSTSGGRTASVSDEWGSDQSSFPYLRSVGDPHDSISPHHNWGPTDAEDDCPNAGRDCVWSASALKQALGGYAPSSIRDFVVTSRNGSRRVANTRLSGPGGPTTVTGGTLRTVLGLRSTWFTIGVLRITGGGTIAQGKKRVLHLLARNVSGAKLQKRVGAGAWTTMREVKGRLDVSVRPHTTTSYRLASRAATSGSVLVRVTAQPSFAAAQPAGALTGVAAPGEPVQVQRLEAGRWVTVAVALTRADTTWRTSLRLEPGVYRAYVSSDGVVGTSPELTVVRG